MSIYSISALAVMLIVIITAIIAEIVLYKFCIKRYKGTIFEDYEGFWVVTVNNIIQASLSVFLFLSVTFFC